MVDKEIKFTFVADDQVSPVLAQMKKNMGAVNQATGAMTGGKGGRRNPGGQNQLPVAPGNSSSLIPGEWARPLRAMGAYRTAWFAGQDMGGKGMTAMKGAAAVFILQAIGDGIKKIVQILSEASPALRAELKILRIGMNELLRPIGDVLASALRPFARMSVQASIYARKEATEGGKMDISKYYSSYLMAMSSYMSGKDPEESEWLRDLVDSSMDLYYSFNTLTGVITTITDLYGRTTIDFDMEKYSSEERRAEEFMKNDINVTNNLYYTGRIDSEELNRMQQSIEINYDKAMMQAWKRSGGY